MAHSDAGRLHAPVTTWPSEAQGGASDGTLDEGIRPLPDLSRLGLLLCLASAVLTLIGIGSALERIIS